MTESSPKNYPPRRFRFGLRWIFWLTTVCAVVAGVLRIFGDDWLLLVVIGGYLVFIAAYVAFRLPFVVSPLLGYSEQWKLIREKRNELQQWTQERRAEIERKRKSDKSP